MKKSNNTELLDYKPKHVIISDIFRDQIMQGKFRKGDKLLPDDDIAKKYNVNKRTVAAGLNALVKEGLLERAPRRGTIVVLDANDGTQTSNAVGMVMFSKGDVYSDMTRVITKRFMEHNLYPILINEQIFYDTESLTAFLKTLSSAPAKPYGYIVDGNGKFPFDYFKENIADFKNVVFMGNYSYYEKIPEAQYVLFDYAEAGRLAARHFISKGHERLTCLAIHEKDYMGPWSSIQVKIMQGFAEECMRSNVHFSDEIFWKLLHGAPYESVVGDLLKEPSRPTAIYSYNDAFVSQKIIPLMKTYELKVGEDIELIGFYNTDHARIHGFSSISIREKVLGEEAVKMLMNNEPGREIIIKPELVIR
jgi:DNA-binding LacI/PurR family transcriptional regulator